MAFQLGVHENRVVDRLDRRVGMCHSEPLDNPTDHQTGLDALACPRSRSMIPSLALQDPAVQQDSAHLVPCPEASE
jgi:hypothetical protein